MRHGFTKPFQLAAVCILAAAVGGCTIIAPPSASHSDPARKTTSATASARPKTPKASHSHVTTPAISPFVSLSNYLAARSGTITAAVYDKRTGKTWLYRPGRRQETASIVKVQIMGTALWQAEHGRPLTPAEKSLMKPMIQQSDNDAATNLLADVGGHAAVQRFDRAAGMPGTTVSTQAFIPGSTLPGWGLTLTTAADEVRLVARFAYPNSLLSDAHRAYGLNFMEHVESDQAWGISGGSYGVLPGAAVALKNGWLPHDLTTDTDWQVNSIGWVHGHDRDYVIAVLADHNPSEAYGIDTINKIARTVFAQLGPGG